MEVNVLGLPIGGEVYRRDQNYEHERVAASEWAKVAAGSSIAESCMARPWCRPRKRRT